MPNYFDYISESANDDLVYESEFITEYENKGPKGINKKLLGYLNKILPSFKRVLTGLEDGTISHADADNFSSTMTFMLWGALPGGASHTFSGQGQINLFWLKQYIKKAKKTNEFQGGDMAKLEELVDALENWKNVARIDRDDRTFLQKMLLTRRETRSTDKILAATKRLVESMEAVRNMASTHFHGESYSLESDRFFGYILSD